MPFEKMNVQEEIKKRLDSNPEFKKAWDESRSEYMVLGELMKIRKNMGLSQIELARRSGNRQQIISRIEKKESSPTLKTLCSLLDAMDYEIKFVPRETVNAKIP